ncbi:MAG TPA: SDR family oxidoreductase [Gemmatimonadaceae bacterium]|nr:SDR family oxidoreductase [Gemmatimonadaceae bacterium]
MKVIVLGGAGMLGHQVVRRLLVDFPETHWTLRGSRHDPAFGAAPWLRDNRAIENVDAEDLLGLASILRSHRPHVVINCLGVIKQRPQAMQFVPSITINSLLPHKVAEVVQAWNGRLIHFSTDCVFSGAKGNYTEEDESDARDLYGRSKFLGEVASDRCLTLRTSIIGPELRHHHSLLDWFLAQSGRTVRGFTRHWWSGVTTVHLADVTARIVQDLPELSGLYQVSSGRTSKYELLEQIRVAFDANVEVVPDDVPFCDRSLHGDKFTAATGYVAPPWSTLLRDLAASRSTTKSFQHR